MRFAIVAALFLAMASSAEAGIFGGLFRGARSCTRTVIRGGSHVVTRHHHVSRGGCSGGSCQAPTK